MLNFKKDDNGFIDINNLDVNLDEFTYGRNFKFVKDNKNYFYKACSEKEVFNEIFSDELLNYLDFPHAHYDVAYKDSLGVLSEGVYSLKGEFIPLYKMYNKLNIKMGYANTIETMRNKILPSICFFTRQDELEKYIKMFCFDIVTANSDRNDLNVGFIKENNKYKLAPIFDNEGIGSPVAYSKHLFFEGVSNSGFDTYDNDVVEELINSEYGVYLERVLSRLDNKKYEEIVKYINDNYDFVFDREYEEELLSKLNKNLNKLKRIKTRG